MAYYIWLLTSLMQVRVLLDPPSLCRAVGFDAFGLVTVEMTYPPTYLFFAPIVYRLGQPPFTQQRGVRFSLGVPV